MELMVLDVRIPYAVVADSILDDCFYPYFLEAAKKFAYSNNCRVAELNGIFYSALNGCEWKCLDKRPNTRMLEDLFMEIAPKDFVLTIRMSTEYKEIER
jgi:hypothetical protein